MSAYPTAEYPSYDGLSAARPDMSTKRAPDATDWEQAVSEILAHQAEFVDRAYGFVMTPLAASATVCEVAIQVTNRKGVAIAEVFQFDLWLSDSAVGAGHTATTASGTVQAKSGGGTVVQAQVAKKALRVQTLATGIFTLEITDSAKTLFKICAQAPGTGRTVVGATLITDNYGS